MSRTKEFIKNALCLAAVSIVLRALSVSFNAYVSSRVGAEGMGLYSLVTSVYGFAVCVACSGINLASTRLCAKALVSGDTEDTRRRLSKIMRACCIYSLFFGILAGGAVFFGAELIGGGILGDVRTVPSLRAMGLTMPALSLSSALAGYFTGVRNPRMNAVVMVCEQGMKILLITSGIVLLLPRGLTWACFAMVIGSGVAEGTSLLTAYLLYLADKRRALPHFEGDDHRARSHGAHAHQVLPPEGDSVPSSANDEIPFFRRLPGKLGEVCSLALPVAVGTYLRQGLVTLEHIAIPRGLRRYGSSSSAALASYGVMQSMAMPVVMFPYAVIGSFTSLLVPEMTSFAQRGEWQRARRAAARVIGTTVLFAFAACGVFMTFSYELGTSLYSSAEAGRLIRALAPALPMMFLDTTVDAMLKGLGEQVYCVKVNTVDAVTSLFLVLILVPRMGIWGYVTVIYVSETVNAAMSISRLCAVTGLGMDLRRFVLLPLCSLIFAGIAYTLAREAMVILWGISPGGSGIPVYCALYMLPSLIPTGEKRRRRTVGTHGV